MNRNRFLMKLTALIAALILICTFLPSESTAYDGAIDQGQDYSDDESMYLYTLEIYLDNPCNSKDMDKDAICTLYFDFVYMPDAASNTRKTYRLDMSYKNGRNLNSEYVSTFIRPNDNACRTGFDVWIPGFLTKVSILLNMDGGERLTFTVENILLDGYRVNTDTDYVSSAYWDSKASIPCRIPASRGQW